MRYFLKDSKSIFNEQKDPKLFYQNDLLFLFHSRKIILGTWRQGKRIQKKRSKDGLLTKRLGFKITHRHLRAV